jgi:hypothetical protein
MCMRSRASCDPLHAHERVYGSGDLDRGRGVQYHFQGGQALDGSAAVSFTAEERYMCVLCETDNLRLLVSRLEALSNRELADAIVIAREAAWQLVLDTADAAAEPDGSEMTSTVGPEGYINYIVERAERDGVVPPAEVALWLDAVRDGTALLDPRVQAFLSSAAEGLATYLLLIREHQLALQRFLEDRNGGVSFAGIGLHGEVLFDRAGERYVVLSDEEAMRIAMDRLSTDLYQEEPARLLEYTNLPPGATDVVSALQRGQPDRANDILAGIVDLQAMTEDRVRQVGFGPFIAEGAAEDFQEQRFGDRIVIRLISPREDPGHE